ncbi:MAG: GNAT family N-acetyltransferase [Bacteroidota bacterium]
MSHHFTFRQEVRESDPVVVRDIVESTGFFYDHETEVAVELVDERLQKGEESGYHFLFAEKDGKTAAYACFGLIPCSRNSYDLYWIVVHDSFRGQGLGKMLMDKTMEVIAGMGGGNVYIETSSREKYLPTQKFYDSCNCILEARLKDFYDKGDDKLIYVKRADDICLLK